jgi:transposase
MSSIMENVGNKRARPRRSFTAQFKAEIVKLCRRGDRTVRQVSQDFDSTETAVREWVKRAELDAGTRSDGLTSDERDELAQCGGRTVDCARTWTSSNAAFFAKETR